jgi:hypothetical protein
MMNRQEPVIFEYGIHYLGNIELPEERGFLYTAPGSINTSLQSNGAVIITSTRFDRNATVSYVTSGGSLANIIPKTIFMPGREAPRQFGKPKRLASGLCFTAALHIRQYEDSVFHHRLSMTPLHNRIVSGLPRLRYWCCIIIYRV